jgi:hypothetical protein
VPAENFPARLSLQQADPGGVGATQLQRGFHEPLQNAARRIGKFLSQGDQGLVLGLVIGRRDGRRLSSAVLRTDSKDTNASAATFKVSMGLSFFIARVRPESVPYPS